jgi:hypothetical protein
MHKARILPQTNSSRLTPTLASEHDARRNFATLTDPARKAAQAAARQAGVSGPAHLLDGRESEKSRLVRNIECVPVHTQ